ncbi:hypothetical protein AX17_002974 [Amanita inopinata Kibby_2008]|nr:hypothetical protein AX17_002974 [Amanita inopinata Kibby_2008]
MNDNNRDAREAAALGLLGLSPSNLYPPPPLIPLKRKQSPVIAQPSDDISCICGFSYDDGFSIACDDCSRWCHAACFDIVEGEVPEEWRCWECVPRPVDKERAVRLQKARLRKVEEHVEGERQRRRASPGVERKHRRASAATALAAAAVTNTTTTTATTNTTTTAAAAAINPSNGLPHPEVTSAPNSKRKRRPSFHEDSNSVVDIDEPWSLSYVHIPHDIIPHKDTREKLRRQAQHWRGVTALDDQAPRTSVRPLPSSSLSSPALSLYTNPSVRPPSYALHTSSSIPSEHLITSYKSTITPSSSYLSDPLNSYAHLGMPRPFVHLIGPPLDLALDSRIAGNSARFARNGCRPNAVLRPFLCPHSKQSQESLSFGVFALRDLKANEEVVLGWEWDDGHVVHSLPALIESPHMFPPYSANDMDRPEKVRHIRNQMSNILHALSSTFTTCACGARAKNCAITQMAAFVDSEATHAAGKRVDLGPLVGARRGFRTRERVPHSGGLGGVEMCDENRVDGARKDESRTAHGHLDVPNLIVSPASPSRSSLKGLKDKGKTSGTSVLSTLNGHDANGEPRLLHIPITFHRSWLADPQIASRQRPSLIQTSRLTSPIIPHDPRPPDPDFGETVNRVNHISDCEDKMPPKMRKKWIHRESEALRESSARCSESPSSSVVSLGGLVNEGGAGLGIRMESGVDADAYQMPPPPVPPKRTPDASLATSPASSFARLSLLSPIIPGPANAPVPGSTRTWSPLSQLQNDAPNTTSQPSPSSPSSPSLTTTPADEELEQPSSSADEDKMEVEVEPLPNPVPASEPPQTRDQYEGEEVVVVSPELPTCISETTIATQPDESPVAISASPSSPPSTTVAPEEPKSWLPTPGIESVSPIAPPAAAVEEDVVEKPVGPDMDMEVTSPEIERALTPPSVTTNVALQPTSPVATNQDVSHSVPKVKMSLKDFAIRKRKQREEEERFKSSVGVGTSVSGSMQRESSVEKECKGREMNSDGEQVGNGRGQQSGYEEDEKMEDGEERKEEVVVKVEDGQSEDREDQEYCMQTDLGVVANFTPSQDSSLQENASSSLPMLQEVVTKEAKEELIEHASIASVPGSISGSYSSPEPPPPPPPQQANGIAGEPGPVHAKPSLQPQEDSTLPDGAPQSQLGKTSSLHEDGEISSNSAHDDTPTPPPQPSKRLTEPPSQPRSCYLPRSHTPPTQPRSFNAANNSNTPAAGPTAARSSLAPYRSSVPPSQPSAGVAMVNVGDAASGTGSPAAAAATSAGSGVGTTTTTSTGTSMNTGTGTGTGTGMGMGTGASAARPLPSGPRALRGANLPLVNRTYSGTQYIPRGPSADRDRLEWERERAWQRSRVRGPGWGR